MKIDEMKLVRQTLRRIGFKTAGSRHKNANGPDCYAIGINKALTVEIKKARKQRSGAFVVPPVEPNRRNDDLIAIVLNQYVLVEPMKHHLKNCSAKGYRAISDLRHDGY